MDVVDPVLLMRSGILRIGLPAQWLPKISELNTEVSAFFCRGIWALHVAMTKKEINSRIISYKYLERKFTTVAWAPTTSVLFSIAYFIPAGQKSLHYASCCAFHGTRQYCLCCSLRWTISISQHYGGCLFHLGAVTTQGYTRQVFYWRVILPILRETHNLSHWMLERRLAVTRPDSR